MLKPKSEHNNKGEKGVALILATFAILFIGGLIGLAIDGGIAFFLKARLSQAMDAASLAGARALARGVDTTAQTQNAQTTAQNYFSANFPHNFWGCTVNTPTVTVNQDVNNAHIRIVQVTGSVTTPLYFLRVLGFTTASLSSTATAQRRDVNIMLVLDRSYSMGQNGAIGPSVTAAESFVNDFAPTRDWLGAVIFGGNYYLYPLNTNFSPGLINAITQTVSSGNTNTVTALWAAYQQLVTQNQSGALNVIVFFTDGLANGVTADMQPFRTNPVNIKNSSGVITTPECGDGTPQTGFFSQQGGFSTQSGATNTGGIWNPTTPGNIVNDQSDGTTSEFISNHAGCIFFTTNNVHNMYQDFNQIPFYDYNGMPTSDISPNWPNNSGAAGNGVVHAWTASPLSWATKANVYRSFLGHPEWLNTSPLNSACTTPGNQVPPNNFGGTGACGLASPWIIGMVSANAADFAAQRWRNAATEGDLNNIVPLVLGITLTEATGEYPDPMLMLRLTNTPSGFDNSGNAITNPIYSSNFPKGTYLNTSEKGELQQLYQSLASQILHLSQ